MTATSSSPAWTHHLGGPCWLRARAALVAALLGSAGCGDAGPTTPVPPALIAVRIHGQVLTATGSPAAGALVHSQGYQVDCATAFGTERDTLMVSDSAGRFRGQLNLEPRARGRGCIRSWATSPSSSARSETRSVQVQFRGTGEGLDSAWVQLQFP